LFLLFVCWVFLLEGGGGYFSFDSEITSHATFANVSTISEKEINSNLLHGTCPTLIRTHAHAHGSASRSHH